MVVARCEYFFFSFFVRFFSNEPIGQLSPALIKITLLRIACVQSIRCVAGQWRSRGIADYAVHLSLARTYFLARLSAVHSHNVRIIFDVATRSLILCSSTSSPLFLLLPLFLILFYLFPLSFLFSRFLCLPLFYLFLSSFIFSVSFFLSVSLFFLLSTSFPFYLLCLSLSILSLLSLTLSFSYLFFFEREHEPLSRPSFSVPNLSSFAAELRYRGKYRRNLVRLMLDLPDLKTASAVTLAREIWNHVTSRCSPQLTKKNQE